MKQSENVGRHIQKLKNIRLVNGDLNLTDEITIVPTPGHTPGHQSLTVTSQNERAYVLGDVAHLPLQIQVPEWNTKADVLPNLGIKTRRETLENARRTGHRRRCWTFPRPRLRSHRHWRNPPLLAAPLTPRFSSINLTRSRQAPSLLNQAARPLTASTAPPLGLPTPSKAPTPARVPRRGTNSAPRAARPRISPPSIRSSAVRKFRSEGLYSPTSCDVTTQSKSTPNCFAEASNRSLSTLEIIASLYRSFKNSQGLETVSSKGPPPLHRLRQNPRLFRYQDETPNLSPSPDTIRDKHLPVTQKRTLLPALPPPTPHTASEARHPATETP